MSRLSPGPRIRRKDPTAENLEKGNPSHPSSAAAPSSAATASAAATPAATQRPAGMPEPPAIAQRLMDAQRRTVHLDSALRMPSPPGKLLGGTPTNSRNSSPQRGPHVVTSNPTSRSGSPSATIQAASRALASRPSFPTPDTRLLGRTPSKHQSGYTSGSSAGGPTQFELSTRLADTEQQLEFYKQRCSRLEDELLVAYTDFVPPASFLPKALQDRHRDVIDAVNDYALLYRSAKLQMLYERCGRYSADGAWISSPTEAADKARLRDQMKKREETQENGYLRDRISMLTQQVEALQSQLAGVRSRPVNNTVYFGNEPGSGDALGRSTPGTRFL